MLRLLLAWTTTLALLPASFAQAVTLERFLLRDGDRLLTDADREHWLNHARCVCDVPLTIDLQLVFSAETTGRIALVLGSSCLDDSGALESACPVLWSVDAVGLDPATSIELGAQAIAGNNCEGKAKTLTLTLIAETDEEDHWTELARQTLRSDTALPVAPKADQLVPGEGLVEVAFRDGRSEKEQAKGEALQFQVLCMGENGKPALPLASPPAYSSFEGCAEVSTSTLTSDLVCSEATAAGDSITVLGLENGREYRFWVLSIDEAGNASPPTYLGTAVPSAEEDFWERYKRSGGAAKSEHCAVAAVFPGQTHPTFERLRRFRETVLRPHEIGRRLIRAYETWSDWVTPALTQYPLLAGGARLGFASLGLAAGVLLEPRCVLSLGAGAALLAFGVLIFRGRRPC